MEDRRHYDCISVEMTEEEIMKMTTDAKLIHILKIGIANRKTLNDHDKIFYGNGKKGIVPIIQGHSLHLAGLWATLGVGGTILIGIVISHMLK